MKKKQLMASFACAVFFYLVCSTPLVSLELMQYQESKLQEKQLERKKKNSEIIYSAFGVASVAVLKVRVPETKVFATMNQLNAEQADMFATGKYDYGEERGFVAVIGGKSIEVNSLKEKNNTYFLAPFYVSSQGTGNFYYVGLFEWNTKKDSFKHVDSFFIGDRILFQKMDVEGDLASIRIKKHSTEQSMAETPNEDHTVNVKMTTKGFVSK